MFQILAAVLFAMAGVPTGPAGLPADQVDRSPLELRPASFQEVTTVTGSRGDRVLIVVAEYLTGPLAAQLAQLQSDIASDGWTVDMQSMSGGNASDLRFLLQNTPDLDGAVFVGFLPCAWYEDDYWAAEEFPCELYFMDLDGTWVDADQDSLFDDHTGDVAPEIWVGRIDAHTAYGPELYLLAQYFEKDHLYRTGAMGLNSRALAFNDDDWSYYDDCGLNDVYGPSGVTVISSQSQTTAENYLSQLSQGYEFVHLMAHSCPWGHTFKVPGGMSGTVMAPEISQVNPRTAFLQLFSCSNARWVEEGCLGNWYLYGTDCGLLVTGAAKTGSMLDFEEYYGPLGTGLCFGESFRDWWEYEAQGGFSDYERAWFYGNALLGDPTLRPVGGGMAPRGTYFPEGAAADFTQLSTSLFSDCHPSVSASQDSPHRLVAAWLSGQNGRLDIAARLYDEVSGWGPVFYVDPDEYWDVGVSACYHDTSPWIAWSDFEYATFSYSIKTACGPGFSQVEVQVAQEGYQINPVLASTGSRLWLAWLDWDGQGGAVMLKSIDEAFPAQRISEWGSWCQNPCMSAEGSGLVHLAWEEREPGGSRIMWSCGGSSGFSAPVEVSSGQLCHSPSLDTRPSDGVTCLTWIDESGGTSVRMRNWNGAVWEPEETVLTTDRRISGVFFSSLPEPDAEGLVWQEGCGPDARIMALPSGAAEPVQLIWFGGPAWSPVSTSEEICWAGDLGEGWEIFCQNLSGLGIGEGEQEGMSPYPFVASNPVHGNLTISLGSGGPDYGSAVLIYDLAGRAVMDADVDIHAGSSISLDCSLLPPGVYMIVFDGGAPPARFLLLR
jgi:hypothetical protein